MSIPCIRNSLLAAMVLGGLVMSGNACADPASYQAYQDRITLSLLDFGLCIKPLIENGRYKVRLEVGGVEEGEIASSADMESPLTSAGKPVSKSILYLWNACAVQLLNLTDACEVGKSRHECSGIAAWATNSAIKAQGK